MVLESRKMKFKLDRKVVEFKFRVGYFIEFLGLDIVLIFNINF